MPDISIRILVLAGMLTLLTGLLLGFPLRKAINQDMGEEAVRGWRVAHSSILVGGVMLLAISSALPFMALSLPFKVITVVLLSTSTFAFCYALIFGAMRLERGLVKSTGALANSIYYGNVVGALLSVGGLALLLYGSIAMFVSY